MQSDMKKILMMFFALMTGVTAASAQQSSGDFFEGLSRKIGFSRMIAPHGLEITYDKTVHKVCTSGINVTFIVGVGVRSCGFIPI